MKITVWRNKRNSNKIIVLKKYRCSHFYWAQYIQTATGKNWMGCIRNRRRFSRITCPTWRPVLEDDYELIKTIEEGGEW